MIEIYLKPSGQPALKIIEDGSADIHTHWVRRITKAFLPEPAGGLISLSCQVREPVLPANLNYWREFGNCFMEHLCQIPELETVTFLQVPFPEKDWIENYILKAPPMMGREYLSAEVLSILWLKMESWLRARLEKNNTQLSQWLKKNGGTWHQVGRVCFHLAENPRSEEYPFAFLATFAPGLSKAGTVQYLPLGNALTEYAGKKNKKILVKLLLPVQKAAEKSGFIKELSDSGELFHPLAWTPSEAYLFLKDIPIMEESGLLVRMPDWWKNRTRPGVRVSIGEKRKKGFGIDTMLDFKVDVALGDR
ncbi:SNF2 helicase-associated domain-containing protein, partial [Candidatus Riflebacteria bacterium]